MKVVILAGGLGSRLGEETSVRPKPMVEIGGRPILWHIMKIYSCYGFREFIVCCGYKGHMIKEYFIHYHLYETNTTFDLSDGGHTDLASTAEPWQVTLANTGHFTQTSGRLLRIREYIGKDQEFMLTYGDGVGDVDIGKLLDFHHSHGKTATITTTRPEGRFGAIKINEAGRVESFKEKARKDQSWVNTGFMVFDRRIFDYLGDGSAMLEDAPFERLALEGEMMAYRHNGFWSPMDNVHDRNYLESLWARNEAPWRIWKP